MIEINLIPDVKQELLKAQRTRTAVISFAILTSIIAASVLVLLLLYVFGVQTLRSSLLDGQIKDGSAKLAKVEDLSKILTIQNQLTKISQLNATKNIDSRVFDMLSGVAPPAANGPKFSQITVSSTDTTIRLEGQAPAYDAMEVFRKTVASAVIQYTKDGTQQETPLASNISTSDVSYGEDAEGKKVLRFVLSFTYPADLFSPATVAPSFKMSVNGNATDSYLGIPKSLFTERAKDL
jgi:hypothetical protein